MFHEFITFLISNKENCDVSNNCVYSLSVSTDSPDFNFLLIFFIIDI